MHETEQMVEELLTANADKVFMQSNKVKRSLPHLFAPLYNDE